MMYRRFILGLALISLAVGISPAYDLRQHAWRHRVLILIAPDGKSPELAAQQHFVRQRRDAVVDRDIRVFQLYLIHGFIANRELSASEVMALRDYLGVGAEDRLVVLIGKDGEIKRKAPLEINVSDIFSQIDAMPMRRDEIRAKK